MVYAIPLVAEDVVSGLVDDFEVCEFLLDCYDMFVCLPEAAQFQVVSGHYLTKRFYYLVHHLELKL